MPTLMLIGVVVGVLAIILMGVAMMVRSFYRKVEQGRALIINTTGEPIVTFTGGMVLPVIYRAELMDISVKTIEIDRRGKEGLICRDNIRADIKVTFFVKVNKTTEDVLKVAQQVGCVRASDQKTLEELFQAKFSEALKTVGKQLDFVELYTKRENFKDEIIRTIGRDLNGYVLDDAAIDFLEQTPIESLDPQNILDAQGIRKITELTAGMNVQTNDLKQAERKQMTKQNVEADEAVLALERQLQDAASKQAREIATMKAREEAETQKVQAEEYKKAQMARIKAEEEVKVSEEAKNRQIEVAKKNRERVIAVETERVEKDRHLEQITRERETELSRIAKEKEIEIQKKEIADVIRSRVVVDKTVAEEEERIKDTRALAEAKRHKDVQVTHAEGEAQEHLVKEVKAAEAMQEVAKFKAKEKLTLADAELEAADRTAKAKIRLAEGQQAESAAKGLAEARVREANATAVEKEGNAKANAVRAHLEAEAAGEQEKGLSRARVREAEAIAREKEGGAEAGAIREKAGAMKALDEATRGHEEFRLRLDMDRQVALAELEAQTRIAEQRAKIMCEAFENANINIVGGDGKFFERFINAVSVGKAIDGVVDNSTQVQHVVGKFLKNGESVSSFIGKMMAGADGETKEKLQSLAEKAIELGVDEPN